MSTLITGVGLVGTSFAQAALERGERLVFFDPEPRGTTSLTGSATPTSPCSGGISAICPR